MKKPRSKYDKKMNEMHEWNRYIDTKEGKKEFNDKIETKKELKREIKKSRKGKGMTTIFPLSGIFLFVVGGPIGWLIGLVLLFSVFKDNKKSVGLAISPFILMIALVIIYFIMGFAGLLPG